jgi:hypothetical protein
VPKTPSFTARVSSASSVGIGFIRRTLPFSASSPLSIFRKGIDAPPFPQESRNRLFLRLPVHRAFEKDGRDDLGSGEGRRGHDAHARLMHEPEHLDLATIGAVGNTIEAQRAGCRSAALVKRGDKTVLAGDLRRHLVIGHDRYPRLRRVRSEQRAQRRLMVSVWTFVNAPFAALLMLEMFYGVGHIDRTAVEPCLFQSQIEDTAGPTKGRPSRSSCSHGCSQQQRRV